MKIKTKTTRLPLILTLILLSTTIFAQKQNAILKLDTKGHTALIKKLIVTKNKDIITASRDKTIRIWDSKTGKEEEDTWTNRCRTKWYDFLYGIKQ